MDNKKGAAGGAAQGAASGAMTGAMAGSVVPGIGTAIGALLGAAVGAAGGGIAGGMSPTGTQNPALPAIPDLSKGAVNIAGQQLGSGPPQLDPNSLVVQQPTLSGPLAVDTQFSMPTAQQAEMLRRMGLL